MSKGRRPLDPRAWYAKATKALITALSAPTAFWQALRGRHAACAPRGGRGGWRRRVGLRAYQRDEAWTWEHMALTAGAGRGRPARPDGRDRGDPLRRDRGKGRARGGLLADAAAMRARLAAAGRAGGTWAVKDGPGGMQDIELLGQATALAAGCAHRTTAAQLDRGGALGLGSAPTRWPRCRPRTRSITGCRAPRGF